jgi:S-methylmethionine-dependent homocysteine/selenocysteine methylase
MQSIFESPEPAARLAERSRARPGLPQLSGRLFLTDGGSETSLIYLNGFDLPYFAAFVLLDIDAGRKALREYYRGYARLAAQQGAGFILESPTWRASRDWGKLLGYDTTRLAAANRKAIALLQEVRDEFATAGTPMVISGCVGPRGDGYLVEEQMTAGEAAEYHFAQAQALASAGTGAGADMITAITMNYVEEAIGVARAAQACGLPVAISFTTETDGRLPSGQSLGAAIEQVDRDTGELPAYYMLNCAHPDHFREVLDSGAGWTQRIRGLRANASRQSHAELDKATELDAGNPAELGQQYRELRAKLPQLNVLGGCCGTDIRHISAIAHACRH